MRRLVADTFSMILFSTVFGGIIEFFIAGLTVGQVLQTRTSAIPAIILIARPYGIYRDWIFKAFRVENGVHRWKPILADAAAFVTFQMPVYIGVLALAGADPAQISAAVGSALIVMIVSGRPYGILLEWSRKLFRVECATPH